MICPTVTYTLPSVNSVRKRDLDEVDYFESLPVAELASNVVGPHSRPIFLGSMRAQGLGCISLASLTKWDSEPVEVGVLELTA